MVTVINFLIGLIESVLGAGIEGIFDLINNLIHPERKQIYDADFKENPGELLSSSNKGFSFGNTSLNYSHSFRNAIVYGSSGAGKSVGIFVTSILRMMGNCSFIINDPSGQLMKLCAAALILAGIDVKVLNYASPKLCGFNPLKRSLYSVSEILKVVKLLIRQSLGNSKEPFWNLASEGLATVFVRLLRYVPEEQRHLASVLHLINVFAFDAKRIDKLIVQTNDAQLINDYKTYVSYDRKMLMSIVATCRAAFSCFADPDIALSTSYDTISFEDCKKRPTCIFINNSVPDMAYYSPITSILVEQFLAFIMSKLPEEESVPVFLLLDECSSLHLNQSLPIAIANVRKYDCGMLLGYQSPFQLKTLFTEQGAKAIEDNAFTKCYLPGMDISTATQLEQTLGKFEFVNENDSRQVRSLMTASELRECNESILLCGNHRAMKVNIKPYYKQPRLLKLTALPPYVPPENEIPETVPLIEIP